jgi:uncharacterized protein
LNFELLIKKMTLHIKVIPNSKIDQLFYDEANNLSTKIKAPAQDGKANAYLVEFLGKIFGIAKSKIEIVSGFTNSHKKLEIDADEVKIKEILNSRMS